MWYFANTVSASYNNNNKTNTCIETSLVRGLHRKTSMKGLYGRSVITCIHKCVPLLLRSKYKIFFSMSTPLCPCPLGFTIDKRRVKKTTRTSLLAHLVIVTRLWARGWPVRSVTTLEAWSRTAVTTYHWRPRSSSFTVTGCWRHIRVVTVELCQVLK